MTEMKRIHDIPDDVRKRYADTVAKALGKAFSEAMPAASAPVAAALFKTFLRNACSPYMQRQDNGLRTKEKILPYFLHKDLCLSRKMLLRTLAKYAWIFGEDEDFGGFPKLCSDRLLAEAESDCRRLLEMVPDADLEALLADPDVKRDYPIERDLRDCYVTHYIPAMIRHELTEILSVEPKGEYPEARAMNRRFVIHVGGTNTGKTYAGLRRLESAATGVYLAPLRLLALEVQETLAGHGVACSLLTGEEEDIVPGAGHISSTAEKLDISRRYDVAVIDECQMIEDKQRGYAWTRAILGVLAPEVHLCTAPEGLKILKLLLDDTGEPYEIIMHERAVPLIRQEEPVEFGDAEKGDAFVGFSRKSVLLAAEELRKKGHDVSVIYGALPYAARRMQVSRFLNGETDVIAATDAIGMGLNLPIRRVVFMEDEKYDGEDTRPLNMREIRQLSGRAGRYGMYDQGYYTEFRQVDLDLIDALDAEAKEEGWIDNTPIARLGFSDLILKPDYPLDVVLKTWSGLPVKAPYVRMDIARFVSIIRRLQGREAIDLPKADLLRAAGVMFDEENDALMQLFVGYVKAYARGCAEIARPERPGDRLDQLELYYKMLDLYYSFARAFGLRYDKDWLDSERLSVSMAIDHLLAHEPRTCLPVCRNCGKPLDWNSEYGLCQDCHDAGMRSVRWPGRSADEDFDWDDEYDD